MAVGRLCCVGAQESADSLVGVAGLISRLCRPIGVHQPITTRPARVVPRAGKENVHRLTLAVSLIVEVLCNIGIVVNIANRVEAVVRLRKVDSCACVGGISCYRRTRAWSETSDKA